MPLVDCPECGKPISDRALACPHCGLGFAGRRALEYRSQTTLFGLPLVHIVMGPVINPQTGHLRYAKGIIAVGPIAVGVVAVGGVAVGGLALGGVAIGLLAAVGGLALGLVLALGGVAVGFIAVGGMALGYYAVGGAAFGAYVVGGNRQDPEAVEFFKKLIGG